MKEHSKTEGVVVGLDLGDKESVYVIVDGEGAVVGQGRVRSNASALRGAFGKLRPARIVIEAGTHSHWVSRTLKELKHEVVVANPRQLSWLSKNVRKSDRKDAALLARVGRVDRELLQPLEHRGEEAQRDLAMLRARKATVEARKGLINHVRGVVKSYGERLPKCSADSFAKQAALALPAELRAALMPLVEEVGRLTVLIKGYDKKVDELSKDRYPETRLLSQVRGVGPITALSFVLTLERPERFEHSREVGAYLGLVPRRHQSGASDPQLRISRAGDKELRRLLVQCSQHILGPHGAASDLRAWGLELTERRGKKKAVVAVARKLAVLLHHLWRTGEVYEPFHKGWRAEMAAELGMAG